MKRFLLAAAIMLSAFLPAHAATQPEIGIGITHSVAQPDGVWYQQRFSHTLKLDSPAFMLGARGDVLPWLAWHADAVWLGRFTSNSQDTPNDANYSASSSTGCNGQCLPMANYIGSGTVYGVAATLEAHTQGAWQVGVEAGPFLYRHSWTMSVPNWYSSTQTGPSTFQAGAASPVHTSDVGTGLGYVAGAWVRRGNTALNVRYYADGLGFPRSGDAWPPIWRFQWVVMLVQAF